MTRILICSYLEPELVERLRVFGGEVTVEFRPDLIPTPRFEADHIGAPFSRSQAQAETWRRLMEQAGILFDFDHVDAPGMRRDGRSVRWVQATSAGIGDFVRRHGLDKMNATFTTASGVHAKPLSEFVAWAMLSFVKNYPVARLQQREHRWERFCGDELAGKTLAVVGLGRIGREIARVAGLLGVRVVGAKRNVEGSRPSDLFVEAVYGPDQIAEMVSTADFVCLSSPATPQTRAMIDADVLASMKPRAVLINVGRGSLIDESALLGALRAGKLAGAVLDVAADEPIPAQHPFWSMDNVIVFPHSASTSRQENAKIVSLFLDNLDRYLSDRPLLNVFDYDRAY